MGSGVPGPPRENRVGDAGAAALATLCGGGGDGGGGGGVPRRLRSLTLNLYGNGVGAAGAAALAALGGLPGLAFSLNLCCKDCGCRVAGACDV